MILLITGSRDFCEAVEGKSRDDYMAERVALGFALDMIGPSAVVTDGNQGAGRWAAIWADRRGFRCDIGMEITADECVCFPGGYRPDIPTYEVVVR